MIGKGILHNMQFNSFQYILLLLPVTVILYYLANRISYTLGKIIIIVSGIVFYAWTDVKTSVVFLLSILVNYAFAKISVRKKTGVFLMIPVAINVLMLFWFKYTNFAIHNINRIFGTGIADLDILLPVGISFFTFQQIAYIVSAYRGDIKDISLIDYLAFILYFPKLLMGPLMEPADFMEQINDSTGKRINPDNIAYGIQAFSFGLFKKVMLADILARPVSWAYEHIHEATAMDWILVTLFASLELYFDFSGYCDMAVGSSLMLNIKLPINFDSPFKALSIRDFWKRWHISLTGFFTKYIYIPLGGSRRGKLRTYLNIMIIFLISGLWHGAAWTFILWGALHGILMIIDRIFGKEEEKVFVPVRWMMTTVVFCLLFLLFRSESVGQFITIMRTILSGQSTEISDGIIWSFYLKEIPFLSDLLHLGSLPERIRGLWMGIYILGSMSICLVPENNYRNLEKKSPVSMVLAAIAFAWGLISIGSESVFLYFNF